MEKYFAGCQQLIVLFNAANMLPCRCYVYICGPQLCICIPVAQTTSLRVVQGGVLLHALTSTFAPSRAHWETLHDMHHTLWTSAALQRVNDKQLTFEEQRARVRAYCQAMCKPHQRGAQGVDHRNVQTFLKRNASKYALWPGYGLTWALACAANCEDDCSASTLCIIDAVVLLQTHNAQSQNARTISPAWEELQACAQSVVLAAASLEPSQGGVCACRSSLAHGSRDTSSWAIVAALRDAANLRRAADGAFLARPHKVARQPPGTAQLRRVTVAHIAHAEQTRIISLSSAGAKGLQIDASFSEGAIQLQASHHQASAANERAMKLQVALIVQRSMAMAAMTCLAVRWVRNDVQMVLDDVDVGSWVWNERFTVRLRSADHCPALPGISAAEVARIAAKGKDGNDHPFLPQAMLVMVFSENVDKA